MRKLTTSEQHERINQVRCPDCGQPPGQPCRSPNGMKAARPHGKRRRAAGDAGLYRPE